MSRYCRRPEKMDHEEKQKLNAAFRALKKQGLITRQDFLCCGGCAAAQLAEDAAKMVERGAKVEGAVTYHKQATDRLRETGKCHLQYGQIMHHRGEGQPGLVMGRPTVEVGQMVAKALTEAGVRFEWDGDPDKYILIDLTAPERKPAPAPEPPRPTEAAPEQAAAEPAPAVIVSLPKPKVKLSGTDGNAFAVLGAVRRELRRAGWTAEQISAFTAEATSGDYNRLLATCMKYADVA
jgi:3-oxoacyl-(acyl-carrier-protein) synthase